MVNKRFFNKAARVVLAVSISIPNIVFGEAQTPSATKLPARWIFQGDQAPADLGFAPLRVGTNGDAEVQVAPRDWFLIKDQAIGLFSASARKTVNIEGPILDDRNAQLYFSAVSGMILKESMVQRLWNSGAARHFIEQAQADGKDFEQTPLEQLGPLPSGLLELYQNWDQPAYRLAVLPYLVLPLSIAYDQSQLLHFNKGPLEDPNSGKACSNISTLPPLAPVQAKIDERLRNLENIDRDVRSATSLSLESGLKQEEIRSVLKTLSDKVEESNNCFSSIRARLSHGGEMPSADCLTLAEKAVSKANPPVNWNEFKNVNLKNEKGDFANESSADLDLTTRQSELKQTQNALVVMTASHDAVASALSKDETSLTTLNQYIDAEKKIATDLSKKWNDQDAELKILRGIKSELDQGIFKGPEAETTKTAIEERLKRMDQIIVDNSSIDTKRAASQKKQDILQLQITSTKQAIDDKKAQLKTYQEQIGDKSSGLTAKIATQSEAVNVATKQFNDFTKEASKSKYVLNLLTQNLAELGVNRDQHGTAINTERTSDKGFKSQLEIAVSIQKQNSGPLRDDLKSLRGLIASYIDESQMGWYLETDCSNRMDKDKSAVGIYLSRNKIDAAAKTTGPVDAGKWGLFNLDYAHSSSAIQSGILLNMPSYIQMAVHQINDDYDYALTQFADPKVTKCTETTTNAGLGAPYLAQMKTAAAIWSEGGDAEAKAKAAVCQQSTKTQDAQNSAKAFATNLQKLIDFRGSVLDAALPQIGRASADNIKERLAISWVTHELGILFGVVQPADSEDSHARRDYVIKSLLRVLSTDYEAELRKAQTTTVSSKFDYHFASAAPIAEPKAGGQALTKYSTYALKTLAAVKLYKEPIAVAAKESGVILSLNDLVKVLPIEEGSDQVVDGGWVRVQVAADGKPELKELWMAAAPLTTSVLLDTDGQPVQGMVSPAGCVDIHVVTQLQTFINGRISMDRYMQSPRLQMVDKNGPLYQIDPNSPKTSAASVTKTYISCGYFDPGQQATKDSFVDSVTKKDFSKILGMRLVEVKILQSYGRKETIYAPIESEGGIVSLWTPGSRPQPRIALGAELDPATWGVKKTADQNKAGLNK
jgi:hypothetical protein